MPRPPRPARQCPALVDHEPGPILVVNVTVNLRFLEDTFCSVEEEKSNFCGSFLDYFDHHDFLDHLDHLDHLVELEKLEEFDQLQCLRSLTDLRHWSYLGISGMQRIEILLI